MNGNRREEKKMITKKTYGLAGKMTWKEYFIYRQCEISVFSKVLI